MKKFLLLIALGWTISATAQSNVNLKITCENEPLCFWNITLKQGDVVLGNTTSDDKGMAYFKNVRLAYSTIDIYGSKNTANGQKDWNVRGYVDVDQSGNAHLEFKPFLDEMGIPVATAVAAWGLNEGGCSQGGSTTASNTSSSSSSSSSNQSTSSGAESTTTTDSGSSAASSNTTETKAAPPTLMTPQESLEGQKTMHENQIAKSTSKLSKMKRELEDETPGTKAHNDLLYDIRLEEIDKEISEKKLEKVELMIANDYSPIPRSQKAPIDDRIDELKEEEKDLKDKKKDDIAYGTEDKLEASSAVSLYTEEDLSNMGGVELRRAKMDASTTLSKKKVKLKTKKAFLSPQEESELQKEIETLEKNIEILDAEIERRGAEKEAEKEEKSGESEQ